MDGVVVLHGIGGSAAVMAPVAAALQQDGYRVLNLSYPSRRHSLQAIAAGLAPQIADFAQSCDGALHFVTHSMGGLVARVLINRYRPARLGRVVMLAPPNGGSELADKLGHWWLFRQILGPAGQQLATSRDAALQRALGATDFPLGIIAARLSISLAGSLMLPGANDGRVSVAATMDRQAADHIVLPAAHTTILLSPRALAQMLHFLREGRFDHQRGGWGSLRLLRQPRQSRHPRKPQWTKRATTSR